MDFWGGSGYAPITQEGDDAAPLIMSQVKVPKNGYVLIFLSNATEGASVFFDHFRVVHELSRILEENTYYPDGMKAAGLSARAFDKLPNRFGYQGVFSEEEEESWYDEFALRLYDPTISRWLGVDPYDEFALPYIGMGNDLVNNVDPDGGSIGGWLKPFLDVLGPLVSHTPLAPGQFSGTMQPVSSSTSSATASSGESSGIWVVISGGGCSG